MSRRKSSTAVANKGKATTSTRPQPEPKPELKNPPSSPDAIENKALNDEGMINSQWEPGQLCLTILACLAVMHTFYFAKAVLMPISIAVVLFFLLSPAVRFLVHWGIPEIAAATMVVLASTLAIGLAGAGLFGPASEWIAEAPSTLQKAQDKLQFLIRPIHRMNQATDEAAEIASQGNDKVQKVTIQQPKVSDAIVNTTASVLAGASITVVMLFMLLAMGHRTLNTIVGMVPKIRDKREVVNLVRDIEKGISGYLLTVTAINVVLGIVIGSVMGLIGLPNPLLIGIMAAALNFIPFVGCFAGASIVFLIGIVSLESAGMALLAPLSYLAINALEGNVITPLLVGRSLQLNPAIVFFAIILWGWAWGIGGVFIAVPLLGIFKITCDHFTQLKPVGRFLGG